MLVRVHDKERNIYFKTEIYAVINSGWYEKQLVVVSFEDGNSFKFFDYLDKSNSKNPQVLINSVTPNGFNSDYEWIHKRIDDVDKHLDDYAKFLRKDIRFFDYRGYSWIYNDKPLLIELLNGGMVSTKGFEYQIIDSNAHKLESWNYIEAQDDINFLMKSAYGFHDSCLKSLDYISGSEVFEDKSMRPVDCIRTLRMIIDSQCCDSIELVFEGLIGLNLRPASDNYSSDIFSATLRIKDEIVFFADDELEADNFEEGYTCVKAFSMRWRFIPRCESI